MATGVKIIMYQLEYLSIYIIISAEEKLIEAWLVIYLGIYDDWCRT